MNNRTLTSIGGIAGIAGGIIGLVANILHPAADDLTNPLSQIQLVADSRIWNVDHLMIMLGVLLVLAFVVAFERTITASAGAAWARLALVFQVVAASTIVVLIGIDGIASKAIFNSWAASSGSDREILTHFVVALEEIDFGVFTTFWMVQYGLVFIMLGLAVWFSGIYRWYLGLVPLILGATATVVAIVWSYIGLAPATIAPGFGAGLILLVWVVTMSVVMLRTKDDTA